MIFLITGSQVLSWFLWLLLIVSVILLIAVILLQEGKGGGLAEAFGGAGAETFGVKAHGINKFTAVVGGAFLVLCIVLNKIHVEGEKTLLIDGYKPPEKTQPAGGNLPGINPPGDVKPPDDAPDDKPKDK